MPHTQTHEQEEREGPIRSVRHFWHILGPGMTTGAADDDPSGIATYSQTGSRFGFDLVWLAAWTFPLMALVQEMCARIGMVTGRGLAANIRLHFPRPVLLASTLLLCGANIFNIGADLGAMTKATQLLLPSVPFLPLILLFTIFSLGLQIFLSYKVYAKYLKWMALVLLAYVVTALMLSDVGWGSVLKRAIVPSFTFDREQVLLLCAIIGTTISPYLFFWQTAQEVEEEILEGRKTIQKRQNATQEEIHRMRVDVWLGMLFSNLVMFFIITTCAATLHVHGLFDIRTAADAAEALRPLAGSGAYLLFALGIVGTGLLAVPVLAGSAAYALAESFGWKEGLYRKLSRARAFYGVIAAAMILGFFLSVVGIDPIRALIYSAIANGIVTPVMLALIVVLASKKSIMGIWKNSSFSTIAGWSVTVLLLAVSVSAIYALLVAAP